MISTWVAIFILFSSGIILAYYELWTAILLLLLLLLLLYALLPRWGREIFVSIMILSMGFAYFQYRGIDEPENLLDLRDRVLSGTIINYPAYKTDRIGFLLKTDEDSPYLRYVQVYSNFKADLAKGDQVTLQGKLEVPDQPGNPGEFDYYSYLRHQQVFYIMSLKQSEDIKHITPAHGLTKLLGSYRSKIEEVVRDVLPESEADILLGMLLGEKENLEQNRYEMFQKTGIVHIFAVSGLHIGFLVLFFSYLASMLNISRRTRFIAVILCLLSYGSLVGWPVSVQRAVIMASLALFAHYQGRGGGLGNSLGIAGMIIVLLDPYALFMTSFQLSFMATWGLLGLYPAIKNYLRYQNLVGDLVLIPFCAQLAVVPLLAYYFNLFSPSGLISNVMISYLVGGIVICGFAALICIFLPTLASLFLYPAGLLIELLQGLAAYVSEIPGAYLWVKTPGPGLVGLYYLGLLLLLAAIYYSWSRRYIWSSATVLIISLAIICLPAGFYKQGILEVVFIDVGQGDSILIKTPRGKFILLDGGGSYYYAVGQKKVLPYLHHRGIRELFMIINSHPDGDHLQGLKETAAQIPFRYAILPETLINAEEYQELKSIAQEKGARVLSAAAGQHINIEAGLDLQVLYPPVGLYSDEHNDHSLVLRCAFGEFTLLLPGDLEQEGLRQMVQNGSLPATLLLKVPHHGSRNSLSEEFYEELHPRVAVISVGENNLYGHPQREVLDYLQKQGIPVLRTDQDGAISFESDGRSIKIDCYKK